MERRRLGPSGLEVTAVDMGTWIARGDNAAAGDPPWFGAAEREAVVRLADAL